VPTSTDVHDGERQQGVALDATPCARGRSAGVNADASVGGLTTTGAVDPDRLVADLFAAEAPSLVRLAGIFCDDRASAEDLVQEAFIRLHRNAGSIRDADKAPAFLRSIVINLARDHNRRGLMSLRHRASVARPESTPGFEDAAAGSADDRATLEAVRRLPDRQRSCLVLRYYLELTEVETAETLGISPNSVKTHCRRGIATLGRLLGGEPT
jgi:RNA polymerase sigma-70 factor (sigma-E family)